MVTLLFWIIVLGLLAWLVNALPIPNPFKTAAWVLLVLLLVIVIFQVFFGVTPLHLPVR